MAEMTVKELAESAGVGTEVFIARLAAKGLKVGPDDIISEQDLNRMLSQAPQKTLSLKRKREVSELKTQDSSGRTQRVRVEVLKKRRVVKPTSPEPSAGLRTPPPVQEPVAKEPPLPSVVEEKPVSGKPQQPAEMIQVQEKKTRRPSSAETEKEERNKRREHADKGHQRFNRSQLMHSVVDADEEDTERRPRMKKRVSVKTQAFEKPTAPVIREVVLPPMIQVSELAQRMSVKGAAVVKTLMALGAPATLNQMIDQDTAELVVNEFGHHVKRLEENAKETELLARVESHEGTMASRAPVVTIMGHVDHGKTSLLDYIRKTQVTQGEAGGITQHIGAYSVNTPKGRITFLDTPGHAAFSAMRARGAQCTDIVVLIVAADDGIMPQTKEAIAHAKAAKVPLIVAINKMDKPGVNAERITHELAGFEVIVEALGGEVQCLPISALTGQGVNELLEAILLQSELIALDARVSGPATGIVIEASLDKGRGPVATLLVQSGQLKVGDVLVAGREYGRVRAMLDEDRNPLKAALPSTPVEILGLSGAPLAGDVVTVVTDERTAREVASLRADKQRARNQLQGPKRVEDLFADQDNTQKVLSVLVKADVQGSLEAIREALSQLATEQVRVEVIAGGVGGISESDVNLAISSQAVMIGFNVRADTKAKELISRHGMLLNYHSIIYKVLDDVTAMMSGMEEGQHEDKIIGVAQVREVFHSSKLGDIAGCIVREGMIKRGRPIRVLRDNVVIYEGELESLRRFKEDVNEVKQGIECGIGVKNYTDVAVGDQIEVFERQ